MSSVARIPPQEPNRVVKKHNTEIGFRIKTGKLSLFSRKLVNVLLYHAQTNPGRMDGSGMFWVEARNLVKDMRFNSNDLKFLMESLEEIQSVRIVRPLTNNRDESVGLVSDVLMPSVAVRNRIQTANVYLDQRREIEMMEGKVKNKPGGALVVGFSLAEYMRDYLLNPAKNFTVLPIDRLVRFHTTCGLVLYEIAKRYESNPARCTYSAPWEAWWRVLTGADDKAPPPEYKYFTRDCIKPALNEINRIPDSQFKLKLEVVRSVGRKVLDIRFALEGKPCQASVELSPPPLDAEVYIRMNTLGISIAEIERLMERFSTEQILATLSYVEARLADPAAKPIGSTAGYFVKALEGDYVGALAKQRELKEQSAKKTQKRYQEQVEGAAKQLTMAIPNDIDLTTQWRAFGKSPIGRTFRSLPESHEEANSRQMAAFKGYLQLQNVQDNAAATLAH